MSIGGFLILIALLGFTVLIIAWPVLFGRRRAGAASDFRQEFGKMPEIVQLRAEREAILQAVRDLDFDYQTGKITDADYLTQREGLIRHGVELSRQIEMQQTTLIESMLESIQSIKSIESTAQAARQTRQD